MKHCLEVRRQGRTSIYDVNLHRLTQINLSLEPHNYMYDYKPLTLSLKYWYLSEYNLG